MVRKKVSIDKEKEINQLQRQISEISSSFVCDIGNTQQSP